ncbi:hypothetical protein JG687_00005676 [Phytophthora cactorum]|uniref:Uncharacterized protein n=1 Tax=Phytophthora cactorum TaxID=29920 RepID=A0A8T1UPR1_9STRA|nr:hypothetical protein JG687_00005676 [Phytophthora cactorum]
MTHTWSDPSLALLVVPVVLGLATIVTHSRSCRTRCSRCRPPTGGAFGALRGCGAILLPLEPRVYGREDFCMAEGYTFRIRYTWYAYGVNQPFGR